jgi:exodeoxyribonuclease V alpha subunit
MNVWNKPPLTENQQTLNALANYLGSGMIKGVGRKYARKIVDRFGLQVLDVIELQPQRLTEIEGIGPSRIAAITAGWQSHRAVAHIMVFLREKGISPAYAAKVFKQYGEQAVAVLTENPYRLAQDIWGIGFKLADQVAQNMGFAPHAVPRVRAGILHAITTELGYGHLYIKLEKLKSATCELLGISLLEHAAVMKSALHDLYNSQTIKLVSHNNNHYITLAQYYGTEKGFAVRLQKFMEYATSEKHIDSLQPSVNTQTFDHHSFETSDDATQVQRPGSIVLNEDQRRGIKACFTNKVTIITGGPGTGKTTLIRKLIEELEAKGLSYKLAAPTGRAAKRMTEGTGRYAVTLHRLLEFDVRTMSFRHNEQYALPIDYLIVDEASMIDIFLAHAIIKALPLSAHLVLIGDADQLPSVGAGAMLNDLILSNKITTIRLTHIFRQANNSLIVLNAHKVNAGEFPTSYDPGAKRDFLFIKETDVTAVPDHLEKLFRETLPRVGIHHEETTVLVPMHKGPVGTQALNQLLQGMLNSSSQQHITTRMGTTFKVGDKVMQLKNNYDKAVFNGDSGIIASIESNYQSLVVNFDEREIEYDRDEFDQLVLAYAISVHKSQGSEYPAVIIPLFMQHFMLLERNLLYTAITRAKKLCILIGQPKAIAIAIKNNKGTARTTFLREFLTTDLVCR